MTFCFCMLVCCKLLACRNWESACPNGYELQGGKCVADVFYDGPVGSLHVTSNLLVASYSP